VNASTLLRRVVDAVEEAAIPYMLVGSFASTWHGAPRTTQDIDIVIDPTPDGLDLVPVRLLDVDTYAATAEDTILSKLEWAAASGSDRQLADAAAVIAVGGSRLDDAYLDHWAAELNITAHLAQARQAAAST
jgi:hypothetical protein